MPTFFSRLGLQYPLGVDPPSELRIADQANATILDNAVLYTEGTFASRPAAGATEHGHVYRSTDTGQWSWNNGTIWIDMGGLAPPTVTSLPGTPYNGQLIDFLADDTNGVVWRFRYRSTSASSHKWEFIGGPPLYAEVATSESANLAAYGDLATVGPAVTAPLAGDYDVTVEARIELGFNTQLGFMSYQLGGTGAVDADSIEAYFGTTVGLVTPSKTRRKTGLTASEALTAKYKTTVGAVTYSQRTIKIQPVRVG